MPEKINTILRNATRKDTDKLNILTIPAHERNESFMAKTGHQFYAWRTLDGSVKDWNTTYAPLPANYHLLNPHLGNFQIPEHIDIDFCLSHNKFGQIQILRQIADSLQLPMISLEHTLPVPSWNPSKLKHLKTMRGDKNVFISEYSRAAWGWEEDEAEVIHHGIDTDFFKPDPNQNKKRHILAVANDYINRNWCLNFDMWKNVTEGLPRKVLGHTPGLSEAAKSTDDLLNNYQETQIFINTSSISPIPMALLEAMSCGVACVSSATCMIPFIITNGENGYITNDEVEMKKMLKMLLDDPKECERIGVNARRTIEEKFSLPAFVDNWNRIFYEAAEINVVKAKS